MRILVTGAAGYIGSHTVAMLRRGGHSVVAIDDLSSGHRQVVPDSVPLLVANVGDVGKVAPFLREHRVTAILHFAAKIQVGESVVDPQIYYRGNLAATIGLLEAALSVGVKQFILSSTAAVYGTPTTVPIPEDHPTVPINPYGETKLAIEKMLASYARAYPLQFAALRYFNAAGADPDEPLGERHDPETHLVPIVLEAALGKRHHVTVFGRDYDTNDGTCIRDYIHVCDLAAAHLAALEHLVAGGQGGAFNLGTGRGYSVAEVLETARRVTGRSIPVEYGARREGDPAVLVASPVRARDVLGFTPVRSSLETIVRDAWAFHARAADCAA
jgi:UDP-glucose 4-epimerase